MSVIQEHLPWDFLGPMLQRQNAQSFHKFECAFEGECARLGNLKTVQGA